MQHGDKQRRRNARKKRVRDLFSKREPAPVYPPSKTDPRPDCEDGRGETSFEEYREAQDVATLESNLATVRSELARTEQELAESERKLGRTRVEMDKTKEDNSRLSWELGQAQRLYGQAMLEIDELKNGGPKAE